MKSSLMKKHLCFFLIFLSVIVFVWPQSAYSGEFNPTPLQLSAPVMLQYDFFGSPLEIPVKVSGTPAITVFLIYTKNQASSISHIRNGYLGWHYVNNVDTCIRDISPMQVRQPKKSMVRR